MRRLIYYLSHVLVLSFGRFIINRNLSKVLKGVYASLFKCKKWTVEFKCDYISFENGSREGHVTITTSYKNIERIEEIELNEGRVKVFTNKRRHVKKLGTRHSTYATSNEKRCAKWLPYYLVRMSFLCQDRETEYKYNIIIRAGSLIRINKER